MLVGWVKSLAEDFINIELLILNIKMMMKKSSECNDQLVIKFLRT